MQMSYLYASDFPFKNFCKLAQHGETIRKKKMFKTTDHDKPHFHSYVFMLFTTISTWIWNLVIFDWFFLSMRIQVILDSLFARPGSAPIGGGKKGEFKYWTKVPLDRMRIDAIRYESSRPFKFFFQQLHWFLQLRSCFNKRFEKERSITLRIDNGGWHATLNLPPVTSCEMFAFRDVLYKA